VVLHLAPCCSICARGAGATPCGPCRARRGGGAATLLFVMALLAKPTGVVAPFLALILETGSRPGRRPRRSRAGLRGRGLARHWLSVLGLGAQAGCVDRAVQPASNRRQRAALGAPVRGRRCVGVLRRAACHALAPDGGLRPDPGSGAWPLSAIGPGFFRRARRAAVASGANARRFRPAAGLFVVGCSDLAWSRSRSSPFDRGDRYAYIAMLGPALALAVAVQSVTTRRARTVLTGIVALLLLVLAVARPPGPRLQDSATLFAHALRVNPRSATLHNNLGVFLARIGRLADAVPEFSAVLASSRTTSTHINLGNALSDGNRRRGAAPLRARDRTGPGMRKAPTTWPHCSLSAPVRAALEHHARQLPRPAQPDRWRTGA